MYFLPYLKIIRNKSLARKFKESNADIVRCKVSYVSKGKGALMIFLMSGLIILTADWFIHLLSAELNKGISLFTVTLGSFLLAFLVYFILMILFVIRKTESYLTSWGLLTATDRYEHESYRFSWQGDGNGSYPSDLLIITGVSDKKKDPVTVIFDEEIEKAHNMINDTNTTDRS